jgi:hypothetical protein
VPRGDRGDGARLGKNPRLQSEEDFVRREVATAIGAGLPIIPLLVEHAEMPARETLPPELRPLCDRNALPVVDALFAECMTRLITAIRAMPDR